jgi:hypothetical protein
VKCEEREREREKETRYSSKTYRGAEKRKPKSEKNKTEK